MAVRCYDADMLPYASWVSVRQGLLIGRSFARCRTWHQPNIVNVFQPQEIATSHSRSDNGPRHCHFTIVR